MTTTQSDLAALSRYVFRAPNWRSSNAFAIFIAALTGIAVFDSQFLLDDLYRGVFYVGIPTLVASVLTTPVDRWLGGRLTYNRSSLLALVCEVIVVIILIGAGIVSLLTPLGQQFVLDVLIGALALIFAFRLAVIMGVSHSNPLIAAVPASIQTATAAVLLLVYSGTLRFLEIGGPILQTYLSRPEQAPAELSIITPQDFGFLIGMCFLYSIAVGAFIRVFDRPWRRSLGINGFDFIRGFIGHIAEGSRELEELFEQIGEEAIVPVTVLSFRLSSGQEKARFVLPMVHPGPMGEIGGGNLPSRIAEASDGLAFPAHATAGHDFNLVTEAEVDTLIDASLRAYTQISYQQTASKSVRTTVGEASVLGQSFGGDGLLVSSFSPHCADDIEYSIGLSTMAEARAAGLDDVLLVDAHNCNDGIESDEFGHVTPGSRRSFDLFDATRQATRSLVRAEQSPFELGVAWDPTVWDERDGIGPLGIRVALFAVNGQETAYVLIDGNNMEPGLRDRIIADIDSVNEVEIMTTDTHIVNTTRSVNQVGASIPEDALRDQIIDLITRARLDSEPVSGGMATEHVEVTVFGNDRTETLASHANAAISLAGPLAGAVILTTVTISILVFLLATIWI